MNREIKFRAWDNDRKKMVHQFSDKLNMKGYLLTWSEDNERLFCGNYMDNGDWQEPELMPYTGVNDIDNKDIYLDDVVSVTYGKGKVSFYSGCYWIEWIDDPEANMELLAIENYKTGRPRKDLRKIGNIYENPELL